MNKYGNVIHGGHGTLTYSRWKSMMQRCHDPKQPHYARYGGAGIQVCERWHDFANFLTDMGDCPSGMTLDRIDNALGYTLGNCRWVTKAAQSANRPSFCVRLTYGGITKNVSEWALDVGISANTLYHRVRVGWSVEKVLTTPVKSHGQRSTRKAA